MGYRRRRRQRRGNRKESWVHSKGEVKTQEEEVELQQDAGQAMMEWVEEQLAHQEILQELKQDNIQEVLGT